METIVVALTSIRRAGAVEKLLSGRRLIELAPLDSAQRPLPGGWALKCPTHRVDAQDVGGHDGCSNTNVCVIKQSPIKQSQANADVGRSGLPSISLQLTVTRATTECSNVQYTRNPLHVQLNVLQLLARIWIAKIEVIPALQDCSSAAAQRTMVTS